MRFSGQPARLWDAAIRAAGVRVCRRRRSCCAMSWNANNTREKRSGERRGSGGGCLERGPRRKVTVNAFYGSRCLHSGAPSVLWAYIFFAKGWIILLPRVSGDGFCECVLQQPENVKERVTERSTGRRLLRRRIFRGLEHERTSLPRLFIVFS